MYRLPLPSDDILQKYYYRYSPILKYEIKAFLDDATRLEDPMGRSGYKFLTGLTSGSVADRWVRSLMDEENLKRLLIGDWNAMTALKDELERIEPDFRLQISMVKHSIRKATADTQVEDLNRILSEIFVDRIYNSKDGKFDKAEFVRLKGMKVCPYCGAQYLKQFRDVKGRFIKPQLDHYLPKSHYPFLALNFFNLFPACKDCNMLDCGKGEKSPLSDDFVHEYLPYPHRFDSSSFNFTCKYDGGADYDNDQYHIDIDYHGNDDLRKGYNEIIPIDTLYRDMTIVPVEIMVAMQERNKEYIELTSSMTGLEGNRFVPTLKSICGFSDDNESAMVHEKHKFKSDIFKSLIRYF